MGAATIVGIWRVTQATFNPPIDTGAGPNVTDAYHLLYPRACDQDDLFIFEAGSIFKDDEGAVKCDSLAPQYEQGTYTQTGSTITVISGTDTSVFNNTTISNTTFTGTVTVDVGFIVDFVTVKGHRCFKP